MEEIISEIFQGPQGSGKTTLAKLRSEEYLTCKILERDTSYLSSPMTKRDFSYINVSCLIIEDCGSFQMIQELDAFIRKLELSCLKCIIYTTQQVLRGNDKEHFKIIPC